MNKDSITELALLFKERDQQKTPSITTGTVIESLPNPRIHLNDTIVLGKENLVFASHLLRGYERKMKFKETNWGKSTTVSDGGQGATPHDHYINLTNEDTLIEFTDTLKNGDEVILIPSKDEQLYFVIDKAVRF